VPIHRQEVAERIDAEQGEIPPARQQHGHSPYFVECG
jgi:hypothetical protein